MKLKLFSSLLILRQGVTTAAAMMERDQVTLQRLDQLDAASTTRLADMHDKNPLTSTTATFTTATRSSVNVSHSLHAMNQSEQTRNQGLTLNAAAPVIQACFYNNDESIPASLQKCWNILAGGETYAGTLCVSTAMHGDAFDIIYNTTSTGWFLDNVHLWIGQHETYPRTKTSLPSTTHFPVRWQRRGLSGPHSVVKTVLPFNQTGSKSSGNDYNSGQVDVQCSHDPSPAAYQLLAQVTVHNASSTSGSVWNGNFVETASSWAIKANVTLTCDCPVPTETFEQDTLESTHAAVEVIQPAVTDEDGWAPSDLSPQGHRRSAEIGMCECACACSDQPSLTPSLLAVGESSWSPSTLQQPSSLPTAVLATSRPPITSKPTPSPSMESELLSDYPSAGPLIGTTNLPTRTPFPATTTQPIPTSSHETDGSSSPSYQVTSPSLNPSKELNEPPTLSPTHGPVSKPILSPHRVSSRPSSFPSDGPDVSTSDYPSVESYEPSTRSPARSPSIAPSSQPTLLPTSVISEPAPSPTSQSSPQNFPSFEPTRQRSGSPTASPSHGSSSHPTVSPVNETNEPTLLPTQKSSLSTFPSNEPSRPTTPPSRGSLSSESPISSPSQSPSTESSTTMMPLSVPTMSPKPIPSSQPSRTPEEALSVAPTGSQAGTTTPTTLSSEIPTSASPTNRPTRQSTKVPSSPTSSPSLAPTKSSCGPSVRRAWHDTSCADREAYLDAVELLYKLPANNSLKIPNYATFVDLHASAVNSAYAHGADDGPFLPWHRWYMWKFEKALQVVSDSCVTVPYWDWAKDSGAEMKSSVLEADTFGSSSGLDRLDGCVTEGLASKNNFWNATLRSGGCLKRTFNMQFARFATEEDLMRLILNYPTFGGGTVGFSNNLQGRPHAVVHNFVGGNMATFFSPDDPLFMLHHATIDRIWALRQDYLNEDQVLAEDISDNCYTAGRGIGLDDPLPFKLGVGSYPSFFRREDGELPTPRDVIHSFGENVQVTYANDYLGLLLTTLDTNYVAANNESWIQLADSPVDEISCSRRLQQANSTSGVDGITAEEATELLGIPNDVPPWTNLTTRLIWGNLTSEGQSARDALNTIAYRVCQEQGNPILASPTWIAMHGMQDSQELFKCFNNGSPGECASDVNIQTSDRTFSLKRKPVYIISYDDTSVKFALSQVWLPSTISRVALHYTDAKGVERCDTSERVFPGEFGIFEAKCDENGRAMVKLYATDDAIASSAPAGSIMQTCGAEGVPSIHTCVHSLTLPCRMAATQCPLPSASDPICDGTSDFSIANDIFDTPKDAESWIFSRIGSSSDLGTYLELAEGTSKTFRVPTSSSNLTITMEVYMLDCSNATDVSLLLNEQFVSLGKFNCSSHDGKSFDSKNVGVRIISEAETAGKVVLVVPAKFYRETGRLTIGIRNAAIGIGSLTMTADCSDSYPAWQDPEVLSILEQVIVP
ncbi:hypothetical protein MPSEU_000749400 [Mayamaea pseudoterrestris]|nr:hypothetical protein MPSEU_000749400 [Mayamaea pseudoterrestris]